MGGVPCDSFLPVRTVAVPLFQNHSYEPLAEDVFTRTFREMIRSLPCWRLQPRREAEGLLQGTLHSVEIYPVAVDSEFLVLEYGMRVSLSLSLKKEESGEVLWEIGPLSEEIRFYASQVPADPSDPMLLQDNRREALIRLSRKMSERAMDRLLLGH
jgi:hypothetical protein